MTHPAAAGAGPERPAARHPAVPRRRGADAGLRRDGLHQPRAWRAVHARRLSRRLAGGGDGAASGCGLLLALPAALAAGAGCWNVLVFRHLYDRDHLSQVLATFGVILFLNEGVKLVWGARRCRCRCPRCCRRHRDHARAAIPDLPRRHPRRRPRHRGRCSGSWSSAPAPACWCARARPTRRWSRRSASISAGCSPWSSPSAPCWRASPGCWPAPILSVEPGMGDNVLILAFVVIVIGGIGSIRGAFLAALLVGLIDTLGQVADAGPDAPVPRRRRRRGRPARRSPRCWSTSPWRRSWRSARRGCSPSAPAEPRMRLRRDLAAGAAARRAGASRRSAGFAASYDDDADGADDDPRHGGGLAVLPGRRGGAGEPRPCRVPRRRRLCGGDPRRPWRDRCAARAARRDRRRGVLRAADRRDRHPHQRRAFHHDHPGLRADGLLHRRLALGLWRR